MAQYKIMTFNMRTQVTGDGENQYLNRRPFIKEFIEREKPDVIGCQEIMPVMYDGMIEDFEDYYVVGAGRGSDLCNEAVCVAFRKDRFYLCDMDTFWLSATPRKPGSRYSGDQSGCPRICTCVTLKPRDGKAFRLYNVHTDHVGKVARILASNQVLQRVSADLAKNPMPFFITGDFNASPDDLCITTVTNYEPVKLVDLMEGCGCTFHGFGKYDNPEYKIDYIFAAADTKVVKTDVFKDKKGELHISDHFPLMATVELE